MSITITPTSDAGAYISGIDLNAASASDVKKIKDALGNHGVAFFRDQSITSESHIAFAARFGEININRFFTPLADYPQIAQVLKEPEHDKNIGEKWHTDHSYDQIPALGSILVARELPASGGDTLFVNMFAAYDALSSEQKDALEGLSATHSSRHVFGSKDKTGRLKNSNAATQDSSHPVVIKHPFSGKRALYVNPEFTVKINELPHAKSESLLNEIYTHTQRSEFMHRFEWLPGSVAFWDNRATWHKALNDYPGQRRLMHRITVQGVALHG
ncbi:MAG: TauD/TfdA family dioxygenase [Granulosicoccaceae bacterium]